MNIRNFLSKKMKQNRALVVIVLGLLGIIILLSLRSGEETTSVDTSAQLPVVTVATGADLRNEDIVSVVGTVRAQSEAIITTEASGRVTAVNATLGQTIPAGFIIATLENATERAAVLQAEGMYEAALAGVAKGTVGVREAETNLSRINNAAVVSYQSAYNTVNGVVRNNIDQLFSDPNGQIPGLRINGRGQTAFLNSERVAFETLLQTWQQKTAVTNGDADLNQALTEAVGHIDRAITFVDTFINLFNNSDQNGGFTTAELTTLSTSFTGQRTTLQQARNAITNDLAAIETGIDALERARINASGAGSTTSVADAQVKQALGSLRSAQANLAKTILRSPIPGTVNSLPIRAGEFIGSQTVAARVANNNALEIVTFIGDQNLDAFSVGETVTVENELTGTITQIAPAVDPTTRRTEVRIAVETDAIQNGDTVTITKAFTPNVSEAQPLFIPLAAVKFNIDDGFVFAVENNRLVAKPVELGIIRGGNVEIVNGLTATDTFVVDARGLIENSEVTIRNQ